MRRNLFSFLTRLFRRPLASDESGAVAILFGLALVPLFGLAAAAIDYNAAQRERARLASALDAAVLLAASTGATTSNVQSVVEASVRTAFGDLPANRTISVTASIDSSAVVAAQAALTVPTLVTKVIGRSSITVSAISKAAASDPSPLEIALVLDTTGSMAGAKIAGLRQAARDLVTTLFNTSGGKAGKVKMAMAPFDQYVNVGTGYSGATWLTNTATYTDATQSCYNTYPNAQYLDPVTVTGTCTADGVSYSCSYTSYNTVIPGAPVQVCQNNQHIWWGCVGSRNYPQDLNDSAGSTNPVPALYDVGCNNTLQRLTTDSAAFTAKINSLGVGGETYIAPGVLWGWRLLSPNPPFNDGAAYGAAKKFLILMTDGFNTHSASYPAHDAYDTADANTVLASTCANAKAAGIRIFAIAFTVTDPTIKSVLQSCASGPVDYYDSTTVSDLQAAFNTIGTKLTTVRLVQ